MTVPIRWPDRDWGVLGVYDREVRSWTEDEVDFVQSVANTVGLAIARQIAEQHGVVKRHRGAHDNRVSHHLHRVRLGAGGPVDQVQHASHGAGWS